MEEKDADIVMEEEKSKVVSQSAQNNIDESRSDDKALEEMTKEEVADAFQCLKESADRNRDLYLRSMAEVENIKKRAAKEKEEWVKYSNENLVKSILPFMDNLEKAVAHARDGSSPDALRQGVELTLKGLKDSLAKSGVLEVQALGALFDPRYHEAVYEVEDDRAPVGTVIQELQKGYTLNGRLIRPAMVVVSKGQAKEAEKREETPREGSFDKRY
jgi:molecular chaperone GrpE